MGRETGGEKKETVQTEVQLIKIMSNEDIYTKTKQHLFRDIFFLVHICFEYVFIYVKRIVLN